MLMAAFFAFVAVTADSSIVVGLSAEPEVARRIAIVERASPYGAPVAAAQALEALSGVAKAETIDENQLRQKLERADRLEAEFRSASADALRNEVITAYEHATRPDPRLQMVVATALHDRAATFLVNGNKREASSDFLEAVRRFPNVPIDAHKHRPDVVQAYQRAAVELKRQPQTRLTVEVLGHGVVMLDGRSLGPTREDFAINVPRGRYMLWVSATDGTSLAHPVNLDGVSRSAHVDLDMESRLTFGAHVTVRCGDDCPEILQRLRTASRLTRVIGIRLTGEASSEAVVAEADGSTHVEPLTSVDAIANPPTLLAQPRHHVAAWSYTPLGIAQFTQGRPVIGAIVATTTAAAVAWNVKATLDRDAGGERDSRTQQNLSAAAIAVTVLGGAIEGYAHDYWDDAYP